MVKMLRTRVERHWYTFVAHSDGLVTVKVGHRKRSAMAGGLGVYGIARLLIRELLRERNGG